MVLGATDRRPRKVVGTQAFKEPGRTEAGLFEQLRHPISIVEHFHENKRVLLVRVPSRVPGTAWQYKGSFWMRAGDALIPMTDEQLRRIHSETGPDFSAEICEAAHQDELDPGAIELLRGLWQRKTTDTNVASRTFDQFLSDAELVVNGRLTYGALILLGTREAMGRHLGQAEIIFEYRSNEAPGPAAERREFRQGFLPVLDEVWHLINLRNDLQHFQQGLFVWDVPTFNERAVREAVLNAVSHRDYRNASSVIIRQFPRRVEIVSPGGFPAGITVENLLWQQSPRNRRIADVLGKCGLVERSGQGFNFIYRECIRQSKPLPDFTHTDAHFVWITLHGEIQDPEFLRFLEEIGREKVAAFSMEDFLVIDCVHRGAPVAGQIESRVDHLVDLGVVERIGRGRGRRLLLSRRFYRFLGKSGEYTRKRGLDRDTNKALVLRHLQDCGDAGCQIAEIQQVLPSQSRDYLKRLLAELRRDRQVRLVGDRRAARWFIST